MLYELSDLGFIKAQGIDAKKFLQGQLTCDVETIISHAAMGAHCNPQGRVISLFYLFFWQDAYYLLLPKTLISIALSALKKYAVFFKTQLSDASHELNAIGCTNELLPPHLVFINVSSPRGILICEPAAEIKPERTLADWKLLDIQAGIPTIYPETSSKFLPHELNLDQLNALNFAKGCYTGQEIIARMHYRGKSKTHMYQAYTTSNHCPQIGADIYNEAGPAGFIVDTGLAAYNQYYILIITNELNHNGALFLDPDKNILLTER